VTSYFFRVANGFLGSELLPASVRRGVMRLLGFEMGKSACIWAKCSFGSNLMSLGKDVFINVGFFFDGNQRLEVKDNVRMGQFVRILTATHEIGPHHQRCLLDVIGKPVIIEEGCWIWSCVTILPGVVVAAGCVIAANSLVTRSTEPDGLYAGIPARRLRDLPLEGERTVAAAGASYVLN